MIGIFELFKVGIGPSSSHTVGPMKAAAHFMESVRRAALLPRVERVRADLYGSLAWTGKGHGSDKAVILGRSGESPESVDPGNADRIVISARQQRMLRLSDGRTIDFDPDRDVVFDGTSRRIFLTRVSKDVGPSGASWSSRRCEASSADAALRLLTMRVLTQ